MDNIYLKEVSKNDIDIFKEYTNDYEYINNNSIFGNEENFINKIRDWKENQNNISKVHFYPFWLMKDDKVIGFTVLKTNIEVDEIWKNHGGNISYEITPSYRQKGYGTLCLHLGLQKLKELGVNDVLITCDIQNIASKKIIENNYGVLKDEIFDKYINKQEYRYNINIDESLKLYNKTK